LSSSAGAELQRLDYRATILMRPARQSG
jgi:hypothetical protein